MRMWYRTAGICAIVSAALCIFAILIGMHRMPIGETILKMLILFVVSGFFSAAILRPKAVQTESAVTGRNKSCEQKSVKCSFSHVAANETALNSLKELKDYLDDPGKYVKYGARMPRGILLYGPPGTGKTLLARALAGEAGVPFFAMSGSDFVEKYAGVGAGRIRELFRKARKAGRCVVFIDEIDAMGKTRSDISSDERDQTLNALLSEMSGFYTGDGVLVIAATNRIEMLDPALLRPGRFDRHIEVGLPGKRERLSILKLHAKDKPLADSVDLEVLAARTTMFSGASLESLLNEAAIRAAARNSVSVELDDIERAYLSFVAGHERKSIAGSSEKCVIALHEAGHALVSRLLMPGNELVRVSILPAGNGAAGYNLCIPEENVTMTKRVLEDQICVLLSGRAAEVLMGGEEALTSGASGDIARASEIAAAMVMELGMGGEPAMSRKVIGMHCGAYPDNARICGAILENQYRRACEILSEHADTLMAITRTLVEEESLTGAAIDAIIDRVSNET